MFTRSLRRVVASSPFVTTTGLRTHMHAAASLSAAEAEEIKKYFSDLTQFVVVGASADRSKFGNKILRCYAAHEKKVIPVNKKEAQIEGLSCKASIADVDSPASTGVSIVTSPAVTKQVLEDGLALGFRHFFLQPGTSDAAVDEVIQREKSKHGESVHFIKNCVLIQLGCEH